jgi:hypothetical protein
MNKIEQETYLFTIERIGLDIPGNGFGKDYWNWWIKGNDYIGNIAGTLPAQSLHLMCGRT